MSQLHGINGAQQPQATGISPSVGKLGLHSVQLGTNPPVRLDAIKGNKIPFAGFRTATKVVNAKTGARENAALALRSLASPDGKLDAKALLNAAKSIEVVTNYWWLWAVPGVVISVFVLAINFFGDGLRDVLDPKQQ